MTDLELLQQYVLGSQDAFAELARRHAHWVYSAARRMLRDGHLAEDVTQAVFIILSQKARGLVRKRSLHGWLFKTTRYTAANALRSQSRRKSHERRAAQMHEASSTDHSQRQPKHHQQDEDFCKQIAPHLEEMVARMRRDDRDALLLRYYRQMSLADVGAALGVSEDTARKRVSRAIQSLRELLRRHGTDIPAGALAGPLLSMTTQPAPPALVTACGAPLAAGAGAAAGMIAQGALLMAATKTKVAIATIILAMLCITAGGVILVRRDASSRKGRGVAPVAVRVPAPRPSDAQVAANREQCAKNLRSLVTAISLYRQQRSGTFLPASGRGGGAAIPTPKDSEGAYPPDLRTLVMETDWATAPFSCPNFGTMVPDSSRQRMDLTARAEWVAAHFDFVLVPNLPADAGPSTVLLYEKDDCEFGEGIHVAFADGHIEFLAIEHAHSLIAGPPALR